MKLNDKSLDRTMAALGHPVRRSIVERVMREPSRVTDLAAPFEMSLPAISKHIVVLERAGLVRRRRAWREQVISFDPAPLDELVAWVDRSRTFWNARLDALEAALRADNVATGKSKKTTKGK